MPGTLQPRAAPPESCDERLNGGLQFSAALRSSIATRLDTFTPRILNPEELHAPTGAILHQFREVALAGRHTRVGDFARPRFSWQ